MMFEEKEGQRCRTAMGVSRVGFNPRDRVFCIREMFELISVFLKNFPGSPILVNVRGVR
jgi:hypothetical protein